MQRRNVLCMRPEASVALPCVGPRRLPQVPGPGPAGRPSWPARYPRRPAYVAPRAPCKGAARSAHGRAAPHTSHFRGPSRRRYGAARAPRPRCAAAMFDSLTLYAVMARPSAAPGASPRARRGSQAGRRDGADPPRRAPGCRRRRPPQDAPGKPGGDGPPHSVAPGPPPVLAASLPALAPRRVGAWPALVGLAHAWQLTKN